MSIISKNLRRWSPQLKREGLIYRDKQIHTQKRKINLIFIYIYIGMYVYGMSMYVYVNK